MHNNYHSYLLNDDQITSFIINGYHIVHPELQTGFNEKICDKLGLEPTMFFYVVKDKNDKLYSIGKLLGDIKQ